MQTLANIGQFEQLQATANAAMGMSQMSVFNDRARMNQIHARIIETDSANLKNDPELEKLVKEEIQEREQQDKSNLTSEQQQELSDWNSMYDYICNASGIKIKIKDLFKL